MSAPARHAPRLLLGVTSLDGRVRATRDRALEVAGRFRESESLAVTLVKALDAGAEAIYGSPAPYLRSALSELRRSVPVVARLPVTPHGADLDDRPWLLAPASIEGAHPGALANARAALTTALRLPSALRGDLGVRVMARIEREVGAMGSRVLRGVSVADDVTDLALAADHRAFFEQMLDFLRARFAGAIGFETRHLGLLLERFGAWSLAPDFVTAPFNPRGIGVRPTLAEALSALESTGIPVLAQELRGAGAVTLAEGAAFALDHGAHGLVPELVDLEDDVNVEVRALAGAHPALTRATPD